MVMLTSSEPPGSSYNYYATRRTPFEGLHNYEVVRYNSEIAPVYSDHDARIRGVPSEAQKTSAGYILQNSMDNALVERSSSLGREAQSSINKALVGRSSSCSRAVQTSNRQMGDAKEYIKHGGGHAHEYVIEEQIHPQFNYHIPSRQTQMELIKMGDNAVRAHSSEIAPVYSDHDARIRGVPSESQNTSAGYILQNSIDNALVERSSSLGREAQSSINKAVVGRSSSCSRAVQTSNRQMDDAKEYIKHRGGHTNEYVIEEQIHPQFNYHIPSKQTNMELVTMVDNAGRAHSVPPRPVSPSNWIKIPREPGLLYFAPFNSNEHHPWPYTKDPDYYDNRRAVFSEPQGTELKYWSKIIPSDSYEVKQLRSSVENALNRSRSLSRDRTLQHQVICEDDSSRALVPFHNFQSIPPAQTEYKIQWIKIPAGPTAINVYPTISSSDPRTWATQKDPLQITNYDSCKAIDSNHSHVVRRSASQSKEQSDNKYVTYEHISKPDVSLEKKKIVIDQRFDRGHKDNRGGDYRSKWVKIAGGPNPYIYSSIHSRDKAAMMEPGMTGYVGTGSYLESIEKSENKAKSQYTRTRDSSFNRNYSVNQSTSKVNKILNSKEDFEKKHFVDMLFNINRIIKEREALGVYEIPSRMKTKINYLTNAVHDISIQNRSRKYIDSYPTESVKSLLSFSSLLAPLLPDHGRTNAISRFNYMLHGPRVHVTNM